MRRLVIAAAILLQCASAIACCCVIPPANAPARSQRGKPSPVTRENYARVQDRASLKEVEGILGPGRETGRFGDVVTMSWEDFGISIVMTFEVFGDGSSILRSKQIIGR